MKVTITNVIKVSEPTLQFVNYCKTKLTFKNPDFEKKRRMGFWTNGTPKTLSLYDEYQGDYYLPLGCFNDIWKLHPIKEDYEDYSVSKRVELESDIKLREYQNPCLKSIEENFNGLFIMPAGTGKTLTALQCFAHLKQKCIWLTHTSDLLSQAKNECESHIKCKTSVITQGKCDYSGDIVFATVQTLVNIIDKGEIPQDAFGMVIADECFPKGTKINTANGYKNIEDIALGDKVLSYNHISKKIEEKEVIELFSKTTKELIDVEINGKIITCTPNHPFYTNRGYIQAVELREGDYVYVLRDVWERNTKRKLQNYKMELFKAKNEKRWKSILLCRLWKKTQHSKSNIIFEVGKVSRKDEKKQSNVSKRHPRKNKCFVISNTSQATNKRWKWERNDETTTNSTREIIRVGDSKYSRTACKNKSKKWKWLSNLLQIGFGNRECETRYRSRWSFSRLFRKTFTGFKKGYVIRKVRVDSAKIQEPRCTNKFGCSNGNYTEVFNIGVKDNENYFAENTLVHNCHHAIISGDSVMMFQKCINYFASRYKVGLTATLHTANGLHVVIPKILGDVIYEMKKQDDEFIGYYMGNEVVRVPSNIFQVPAEVHFIPTEYSAVGKDIYDKYNQTVSFSKLISDISNDEERNNLIYDLIMALNGSTIIVSDRVEQLKYLCERTPNSVFVDGKTNKKQREQDLECVRQGGYKYLFASYKLICEGFNAPILENIVLATPVKDFRIIVQSVGRVQRPYKGKTIAKVYDLIDDVGKLDKFYKERKKIYKKEGYKIL